MKRLILNDLFRYGIVSSINPNNLEFYSTFIISCLTFIIIAMGGG